MKKTFKIVFVGGRDRGYECIKLLYTRKEEPLHIFCMPEDEHEKIKFLPKINKFAQDKKIPITIGSGVEVLTGDGIILLEQVQFENQNKTNASGIISSVRVSLGGTPL